MEGTCTDVAGSGPGGKSRSRLDFRGATASHGAVKPGFLFGALVATVLGLGCGPSGHTFEPTPPPPKPESSGAQQGVSGEAPTSNGTDAPEVTRSNGAKGGVVVFWPRVIPKASDSETHDLAAKVQQKVVDLVKKTLPDAEVDVRPEPERVCPRVGCTAMTVGALFTRTRADVR